MSAGHKAASIGGLVAGCSQKAALPYLLRCLASRSMLRQNGWTTSAIEGGAATVRAALGS
jgi:hypothetical protein